MEDNNIEIFGAIKSAKRIRHGHFITVNLKNRNVYISRELSKLFFGTRIDGTLNVVHSKIEDNWYVAVHTGTLFENGFECVRNDKENESTFRVNGAIDVFKKAITTLYGENDKERYRIGVSVNPVSYDGFILYKLEKID